MTDMTPDDDPVVFESEPVVTQTYVCDNVWRPYAPRTKKEWLHWLRRRIRLFGAPLPDGFVPPPGVDIDALLREIGWPPRSDAPPPA